MESRDWTLAAILIGGLVLIGALANWALSRVDHDELEALEQIELPDLEVAQRFGAPNGGGVIVSVAFGS
jgi:hypothetical protein